MPGVVEDTVLVLAPVRRTFDDFLCEIGHEQPWLTVESDDDGCRWQGRGRTLRLEVATTAEEAHQRLLGTYYHNIIVDCRHPPSALAEADRQEGELFSLLDFVEAEPDFERRYPLRRIGVMVGDPAPDRLGRLVFAIGQRHVGACLQDVSLLPGTSSASQKAELVERLWEFCHAARTPSGVGKRSICAAGGGLTGVYYHLGVLKCLNDAMVGMGVQDFDMLFGISAGSVITSLIANGFRVDEVIKNLGGIDKTWPGKLHLTLSQLNVGEVPKRFGIANRNMVQYVADLLRGDQGLNMHAFLDAYAPLLAPMFDHSRIEELFRDLFSMPERTNDFRKLPNELYIGVTDQDRREHVLLGEGLFADVPISEAVLASTAIHPLFRSVKLKGRHYTDGFVTRTSNIKAAIDKGSTLVFVIDPFLPLVSQEAGLNAMKSNLWVLVQDFKTLSYTRFEQVSQQILRQNPHVSCYTFLPSNRMRKVLAQNPMFATHFHPIVTGAYASTYRRLAQLEYKVAGDLEMHGISLDLRPVGVKVEKAEKSTKPNAKILLS